jgi:hypothetical protein
MKAINAYPRNITPKMWQCREPVAIAKRGCKDNKHEKKKSTKEKNIYRFILCVVLQHKISA